MAWHSENARFGQDFHEKNKNKTSLQRGDKSMKNRFTNNSSSVFGISRHHPSVMGQSNLKKKRRKRKNYPYISQSTHQPRYQCSNTSANIDIASNDDSSSEGLAAQNESSTGNLSSKKDNFIVISSDSDYDHLAPSTSTNATKLLKNNVSRNELQPNCAVTNQSNDSEIIILSDSDIFEERHDGSHSGISSPNQGTKRKLEKEKVFHKLPEKQMRLEKKNPVAAQRFSPNEVKALFEKDKLSQQIRKFLVLNEQKPWFLAKKLELAEALEKSLNYAVIPDCRLHLVGSSINGFGRLNSDADMCLVVNPHLNTIKKRKGLDILFKIKRLLIQTTFARDLTVIPAKVCILKFKDASSGMECDINVNNLTGLRNTQLMYAYAQCDPRVRPLVLCLKEWAHENDINDASQGSLSSYALVLMVLHYLQFGVTPCVAPNLQELHPDLFSPSIPIHLLKKHALSVAVVRSENRQSLSELLIGFFQYFANYNFKKVMSIRRGNCFLPKESGPDNIWKQKMIRIEEPFDLSNVARAVQQEVAPKIMSLFKLTSRRLKPNCNLKKLIYAAPRLDEL